MFPKPYNAPALRVPLPPDLLSAFNAAVFCAGTAERAYSGLVNIPPGANAEPALSAGVLPLLAQLNEYRDEARAAVRAVFHELTEARQQPSPLPNVGADNAHWLALQTADRLQQEIWKTADPAGWKRHLFDASARMDANALVGNLPQVCQHLRGLSLTPPGSLGSGSLLAQIQVEATRAAEARKLRAQAQAQEQPPAGDRAGTRPKQAGAGQGERVGESRTLAPPAKEQNKAARTDEWIWAPEGNGYLVAALGERGHFSKLKGLAMIEKLVQSPGQPVPMALLAGCAGEQLKKDKRTKQPTMDRQALQEAYNRSSVLRTELEQAEAEGRTLEADEHRAELEALQREIRSVLGIKGKVRDLNDLANKLRPTIHARLNQVYKAMREATPAMPRLAEYLDSAIGSEGAAFVYRPAINVTWITAK
jgi:hypothetical protein